MFVKDGDGTLIDFQWPSFNYWFRGGLAFTLGASVVGFFGYVFWAIIGWRLTYYLMLRGLG